MGDSAHVIELATAPGDAKSDAPMYDPRRHGGIGKRLESLRRELLEAGERLQSIVEPAGQTLVSEASKLLEKQVCRIAVVGQIKSGKSTFVNAFAQIPALLPTDVNPWTTAVTNLHFRRRQDGDPAAKFNFFTEEEWQRIADGGGLLRELTERLVPGFEPDLLRQHVVALKQRAAQRLGNEFTNLLGQSHSFSEFDAGLMRGYVCSGDMPRGPVDNDSGLFPGKYSDITCSADIHCDGGPFEFPAMLVDTPGTNDPFLLRDEITRRSLEAADLYIVVLTARQPLSEADVALLRILRGLHKERILIFINRIDDLSEISADLADVTAFVRKRIEREFPDSDIPIISGSALWATAALRADTPTTERAFEHRSLSYFLERGLIRREELLKPAPADGTQRTDLLNAQFVCSGMPAIYSAINDMMGASHCAHVLRQVAQCYVELARASENSALSELTHLERLHSAAITTAERAGTQMRQIDAEQHQLEEIAEIIERSGRSIEDQMGEIVAEEIGDLRSRLFAEVDVHAAEERDVLIDTLYRGRAPREWQCESIELRRSLAEIFTEGFQKSARRISDLQSRVTPELRQLMSMIAPRERAPREPDWSQLTMPTPTLTSLSTFVAVDLEVSWWAAFFSKRPTPEERGAEVEALIRSEFEAVVEELVSGAETELLAFSSMMTRWSFGVCNSIIEALHRRRQELSRTHESLSKTVDGTADTETVTHQSSEIARLRSRLAQCETLNRQLEQIATSLARSASATSSRTGE
ncbi:conserved protein of unknown function [Candidatus Filomicrobium marinum]|uniref:Dynamin N-terminal domain-containing protein n=2 Tax=Filomicrobium TaxID=119044 RepID=A0A0D6JF31_9HYPH|nr:MULTISPECIES: dynamin family protein [Filomicrobium]CFX22232.1 conserved protein of unknown function [Candidatus Filomicrobium marinum]CPR18886.1 conserved protein of unknown function [Candidatus Filomicrobium marinum]SDO12937.1 Dynamin family protein [Filomicrobium insigne]